MRVMVTRPQPDAGEQARKLEALGIRVLIEPLLKIEFLAPAGLDAKALAGAQGLIVTSRNGLRALAQLSLFEEARHLPLLAVGGATARAAEKLGFAKVHEGPGRAEDLVDTIRDRFRPGEGALIQLAGEDQAFDLKGALADEGFQVITHVLYRASPKQELSGTLMSAFELSSVDGVILMSPRTAKTYLRLIAAAGLNEAAGRCAHFCLSQAVADAAAGLAQAQYLVANRPREDDLLALVAEHASD